ncbi:MAG: 16S rRNA (cytosine(1402)-N(4))-methyltransferase RsmH [Chloroflexota bacterium]
MVILGTPDLYHTPVMLPEALEGLRVREGGRYVDANLGEGGHAAAVLARGGHVLGIDADPDAVSVARDRIAVEAPEAADRFAAVNANFREIAAVVEEHGWSGVDGVLFDLGLSSRQLEASERGFSFQRHDPLDMRFNPADEVTAADIVNTYSRDSLADLIYKYGGERRSRQIATAIIRARPLRTSAELAQAIARGSGPGGGRGIHPATRTFQALRIAVNDELNALETALDQAVKLLDSGGRLVVISYHSLEDRMVKSLMRTESSDSISAPETVTGWRPHERQLRMVHRGVMRPGMEEVNQNPRSRSARMRIAEKI